MRPSLYLGLTCPRKESTMRISAHRARRQGELFGNPQRELFRDASQPSEGASRVLPFGEAQARRELRCTLCLMKRPLVWSVSTNVRHSLQVCEFCLQKVELAEREGPLDS